MLPIIEKKEKENYLFDKDDDEEFDDSMIDLDYMNMVPKISIVKSLDGYDDYHFEFLK